MVNLKRFFVCLFLALILISSSVLATNTTNDVANSINPIQVEEDTSNTSTTPVKTLNEDLYIYNTDYYSLNDIIYGNVFASVNKFVTNPKNNGGFISGNLYLISNEAIIGSDVTYSNNQDRNGNYIIESINSNSVINGNVYVLSDSFTLQAGSEIHGDLYIASTNVNIEQDAVIDGNIFITASDINLNGQVKGSVYITSNNFNMNFYTYITQDLYLNAENATLSGVVHRNAFVTAYDKLSTDSNFRVNQNLSVDFANEFNFSGEVQGNATINAKTLTFKNENNANCIIRGNLNYGTQDDTQIPDGVVSGQVSTFEFEERTNNEYSIASLTLKFFTLLVYVFLTVFLSKLLAPKAIEKISEFKFTNIIISLGVGFISLFAAMLIFMLLAFSIIGIPLAFVFILGYLFVLGLALPLVAHNIANALKFKLNIYVKLLIITVIIYLLSLIPLVGSIVIFVLLLTGAGQILVELIKRKK